MSFSRIFLASLFMSATAFAGIWDDAKAIKTIELVEDVRIMPNTSSTPLGNKCKLLHDKSDSPRRIKAGKKFEFNGLSNLNDGSYYEVGLSITNSATASHIACQPREFVCPGLHNYEGCSGRMWNARLSDIEKNLLPAAKLNFIEEVIID